MNSKNKTRVLVSVAMLSAISYVLVFIELPMPLSPSFAKMDISDLLALIAAFAFSPVSGIAVEFVKNGLQLILTTTAGVGELANFLMGSALAFFAGLAYNRNKTKKTALIGCICGSVAMAIAAFGAFRLSKPSWMWCCGTLYRIICSKALRFQQLPF